jgi:hypothetical protein
MTCDENDRARPAGTNRTFLPGRRWVQDTRGIRLVSSTKYPCPSWHTDLGWQGPARQVVAIAKRWQYTR